MAKTFYETILAQGGFAGNVFDIAAGPANTGVISVLLNAGDGNLQEDAPINLISTGPLGAPRQVILLGIEQPGRFFFCSIRNSDISTNNITFVPTVSINGSATLVVSAATDYIIVHESAGVWRAYQQSISGSGSGSSGFSG